MSVTATRISRPYGRSGYVYPATTSVVAPCAMPVAMSKTECPEGEEVTVTKKTLVKSSETFIKPPPCPKPCDPCAEQDPCAPHGSHMGHKGWQMYGGHPYSGYMWIMWLICILVVISVIFVILLSFPPGFALTQNASGQQVVDTTKIFLISVVLALLLIFILWVISFAWC